MDPHPKLPALPTQTPEPQYIKQGKNQAWSVGNQPNLRWIEFQNTETDDENIYL